MLADELRRLSAGNHITESEDFKRDIKAIIEIIKENLIEEAKKGLYTYKFYLSEEVTTKYFSNDVDNFTQAITKYFKSEGLSVRPEVSKLDNGLYLATAIIFYWKL